jgi:hypothetical protein
MNSYVILIILTFSLFTNRTLSQSNNGYTTSTTIIENAELVGDHEIDTGKFVILKYRYSFNIPGVNDEEHNRYIFVKLTSLDNLRLNKSYLLPDSTISISIFFRSPWSYSETKKISGTITRTKNIDSVQEFNLHLDFINKKGQADTLLYGNYKFKKDINYFVDNNVEYSGDYDNFRIALKETLKVKKLDLSYHQIIAV